MTGLNHDWDKGEGPNHADFVHGAVPVSDFDDEIPYRKKRRRRRRGKVCAKSKANEPCEFTIRTIKTYYWSKYYEKYMYYGSMACHRCGRHGGWFSGTSTIPPRG